MSVRVMSNVETKNFVPSSSAATHVHSAEKEPRVHASPTIVRFVNAPKGTLEVHIPSVGLNVMEIETVLRQDQHVFTACAKILVTDLVALMLTVTCVV